MKWLACLLTLFVAAICNAATTTLNWSALPTGQGAYTVTATGGSTSWTPATNWTISGGTGVSISWANVSTSQETLVINPGSTQAVLTVSNSTDSSTVTINACGAVLPLPTNWTSGTVGSTSAGAAGTTTGAGTLQDVAGNNVLLATSPYRLSLLQATSGDWQNKEHALTPSGFNVRDSIAVSYYTQSEINGNNYYHVHRYQASGQCYLLAFNGSKAYQVTTINSAGTSQSTLSTGSTFPSLIPSTDLIRATSYTIGGSGATAIAMNLYDITTSTDYGTYNYTDSGNSGPQTAGPTGLSISHAGKIQAFGAYNGSVAQISLSPSAGFASVATTTNVTGTGTSFPAASTTNFTLTPTVSGSTSLVTSATAGTVSATFATAGVYQILDNTSGATAYYTVSVGATGYSQTLSSTNVQVGTALVITYNLTGGLGLNNPLVITPGISGLNGTFSPTTVTLAPGATSGSCTFTANAGQTGTGTLSATHTGGNTGQTNPANATFNSYTLTTIAITNSAIVRSPMNWKLVSNYIQTMNNGAYERFYFNGSANPVCNWLSPNSATGQLIAFKINGQWINGISPSNGFSCTPYLSASALNVIEMYVQSSPQSSRWNNGTNVLQTSGFTLDNFSTPVAQAQTFNWVVFFGDSIPDGVIANISTSLGYIQIVDDATASYTFLVGQQFRALGWEYCVSGFGGEGYNQTGDSTNDIPAFYPTSGGSWLPGSSRWPYIDSGVSMFDSNNHLSAYGSTGSEPSMIWQELMINDFLHTTSTTNLQSSVQLWLAACRAAAPAAWIVQGIAPMIQSSNSVYSGASAYTSAVNAGAVAYQAATPRDSKSVIVNFGSTLANTMTQLHYINSGYVHPTYAGHALLAPVYAYWMFHLAVPTVQTILKYGFGRFGW